MMEETTLEALRKHPWIIPMLKYKIFHEECDRHSKKKRCLFCMDCMSPPFCDRCNSNQTSNEHEGHHLLRTFRSSKQTGVRVGTISKFLYLTDIQLYAINHYKIVYINQRKELGAEHSIRNNAMRSTRNCLVCGWLLDQLASSKFCSIECQIRNTLGTKFDEFINPVARPVRRHRRKGIPVRSPMF